MDIVRIDNYYRSLNNILKINDSIILGFNKDITFTSITQLSFNLFYVGYANPTEIHTIRNESDYYYPQLIEE